MRAGGLVYFQFLTMSASVWFLVGATASGKSAAAFEMAKARDAEIVGADAFQVYEGLPLLSAKPESEFMAEVPHHLIGEVPLTEAYHVRRYLEEATKQIEEIIMQRNRSVIVVGGTGLYVKALTHGLSSLPSGDEAMRSMLEALETDALFLKLQELDPVESTRIDRHNRRRLVRAIEVCLLTGKPISAQRNQWSQAQSPLCKWLPTSPAKLGKYLYRERSQLRERIDQRVEEMFHRGVVEEVERVVTNLREEQKSLSATAQNMLGLTEIQELLEDKIALPECKQKIKTATAQYAKRQNTWFKKESQFELWDVTDHFAS